jgi:exosortase
MNATVSLAAPAERAQHLRLDWVMLAAFGVLWLEVVSRLRFEWSVNPQYGYGWTVPFLAAYAFWRRWQNAPPPSKPRTVIFPVLLMAAAVLFLVPVRLIQEANPDWRILSWSMALAAVVISLGGVYLAGGLAWLRHFAFPVLFFLVAVPWPTQLEQFVIQNLMRAVAAINVELVNAIGITAVQMGNVIELRSGFVGIDDACTGVRSLQATFMVSLFLGEFYQFSLVRRLVLIVAGASLAFICNLIRTFLLVYVGAEKGVDAIKNWHDPAGLTILTACLFGLWGVSMLMGGGKAVPRQNEPATRTPFPIPRLLAAGLLGLTITAEAATQAWYGYHEARAERAEPWSVTWPTQARGWKDVPVAENAQELLRYNEGGGGTWVGPDGHEWTMYFFRWLPGRTAGLFIKNHRPDICLPASGMKLRRGAQNKLLEANGVKLPLRTYIFESGSKLLHVFYCYWDGSPAETAPQDQETWTASSRLEAARRGKREVGTQMLEIVAVGYQNEADAERAVQEQLSAVIKRD